MRRNVILFLLAYLYSDHCLSQQYPFVLYTPKDGLVNNRARFITQDSKGLLYISTFGGLSIYDGSRFTNYTTDNGLSTNIINDIVEMGNDSLWIIPNTHKLHCLAKGVIKDIFTSDGFYPVINKMIYGSDGNYYALADEGLFRFEKSHFVKVSLIDKLGRDVGRYFISGAEIKNKLLMITDAEVQDFPSPGRLVVYDLQTHRAEISDSISAYFVASSPKQEILVSTKKGIQKLDADALQQNKIRFGPLPKVYSSVGKISPNYIYFDHQKNLWLSSARGLTKIDPQGHVQLFSNKNGLTVNSQSFIYQDKENTMWFTNEQTGISKLANPSFELYNQIKPGFSTNDIYSDNLSDSVWFLDNSHNKLLLRSSNNLKVFSLPADLAGVRYKSFITDRNKYYLLDFFNLYECSFVSGKKISLKKLISDSIHFYYRGYNYMLPDGYGNLLICSENLYVLLKNKKTIFYPLGYFTDMFVLTPDKHLWIVTRSKKIFCFLVHPDDPDHYLQLLNIYSNELPEMSPRSIAADKKGNIWIGTRDNGLFCLFINNGQLQSWKQITTKNGLSDNFITYLHTDQEDHIWSCSPGGLDKIKLNAGNFFIENITRSNHVYQYVTKIQTTKEGVHWVRTADGIIKINPVQKIESDFQPKIVFREIDENKNRVDDSSGLLSLPYKKNNLFFSVASPSYVDEKQIRFQYLLEGSSDKSWSDPSPQAFINFVNIAPGKYRLRVKAVFLNGQYADSETSYSFVIHPPWWQTVWFRAGIIFLTMVIIGLIVRAYYQQKLRKQQIALEKQKALEKERTRIAADMHDDLGAGLSTIRFLSEKVKRNISSQVAIGDIERMQSASNELIDKMNEIIWSMSEKNDTLEDLVFYIRSYSMEYCEDNNLECHIEVPENIPSVFVSGEIRRNIFLTVKESMHNIVKHAHAKHVEIIINISVSLDITITDDGKGFTVSSESRTGNGLRNMFQRIESVGGKLNIRNDHGTFIRINVPLN